MQTATTFVLGITWKAQSNNSKYSVSIFTVAFMSFEKTAQWRRYCIINFIE